MKIHKISSNIYNIHIYYEVEERGGGGGGCGGDLIHVERGFLIYFVPGSDIINKWFWVGGSKRRVTHYTLRWFIKFVVKWLMLEFCWDYKIMSSDLCKFLFIRFWLISSLNFIIIFSLIIYGLILFISGRHKNIFLKE